jgi:hypothetical protein
MARICAEEEEEGFSQMMRICVEEEEFLAVGADFRGLKIICDAYN